MVALAREREDAQQLVEEPGGEQCGHVTDIVGGGNLHDLGADEP